MMCVEMANTPLFNFENAVIVDNEASYASFTFVPRNNSSGIIF